MCAPLAVAALSVPMLGETVTRRQWIAIGTGLRRARRPRAKIGSSTKGSAVAPRRKLTCSGG